MNPPDPLRWRKFTDFAKRNPSLLKLASPLARGKGRLRFLDRLVAHRKPDPPDFSNWNLHELAACWIGHATVLLRVGGFNIITDPVFSSRIGLNGLLLTLGPARLNPPACTIEQLPPIHLVLISHAHFDHLDRPSLYQLAIRAKRNGDDPPRVICADQTQDLIDDLGFSNVHTLLPDQPGIELGQLLIRAIRVKHWGARIVTDSQRGYCGFSIQSPTRHVLFGGDSAYHNHWTRLESWSPSPTDLAIVGIGAYQPWIQGHANPEQAWEMSTHARARFVMPIHHSTFRLGTEPLLEPLQRFIRAAGERVGDLVCVSTGDQWVATR